MLTTLVGVNGNTISGTRNGLAKDFECGEKCVVTLNGAPSSLADLKGGDTLEVEGQPAIAVRATRSLSKESVRESERELRRQEKAAQDAKR